MDRIASRRVRGQSSVLDHRVSEDPAGGLHTLDGSSSPQTEDGSPPAHPSRHNLAMNTKPLPRVQRQTQSGQLVVDEGSAKAIDLAERFVVSVMTIHRDFD